MTHKTHYPFPVFYAPDHLPPLSWVERVQEVVGQPINAETRARLRALSSAIASEILAMDQRTQDHRDARELIDAYEAQIAQAEHRLADEDLHRRLWNNYRWGPR